MRREHHQAEDKASGRALPSLPYGGPSSGASGPVVARSSRSSAVGDSGSPEAVGATRPSRSRRSVGSLSTVRFGRHPRKVHATESTVPPLYPVIYCLTSPNHETLRQPVASRARSHPRRSFGRRQPADAVRAYGDLTSPSGRSRMARPSCLRTTPEVDSSSSARPRPRPR